MSAGTFGPSKNESGTGCRVTALELSRVAATVTVSTFAGCFARSVSDSLFNPPHFKRKFPAP